MNYKDYETKPVDDGGLAPTFLTTPAAQALLGGMGGVKDALADRAKMAAQVGMPLVAPTDALPKLGVERSIPRGLTESDASYAQRLTGAWTTWPFAGTAFGLLTAFFQTGYTNVVLAQPNGGTFYTLDSGGNLVRDVRPSWTPTSVGDSFWSRFDVIFPSPLPPSWISGGVPSSSSGEANLIRLLISQWKPAYATCYRIIILTAGRILGYPARTLGAGNGVLGGDTTLWSP